ncbi:uncharacterized protein ccdc180 isoform X3 [Xiphophorus hellerii]|uniref:uncharacterized protein ccdc180 isoform X3 n=1 Tax=Xiphophorus hellerii TaxID=8084 RepID=UPI0013B37E34|nr:uncharacterized protein LOC116729184 isoform X3 [Xiphophorus hellerii]
MGPSTSRVAIVTINHKEPLNRTGPTDRETDSRTRETNRHRRPAASFPRIFFLRLSGDPDPAGGSGPGGRMSGNRAIPGGKVYRQLFDAQAQLSRSLLAGRRVQRTGSLSPVYSKTPESSSRWQQRSDVVDGSADVIRLPDRLAIDGSSFGIIDKLTKRRMKKHDEALRQQEAELHHLSQVCELEVRSICEQLVSSLEEVDLRLDILKDRIGQQPVSLQGLRSLWEEADGEMRQKKSRVSEMQQKLKTCDDGRSLEITKILKKQLLRLEQIGFLSPPDVHRLIHAKAMMLNQSLLANQRSSARLVLLLQDQNLQQELVLRLHWEESLDHWRTGRVEEMLEELRTVCSSREGERNLFSDQMKQNQEVLVQQRSEVIYKICSLVPPTCSVALASNWFNELTAINQQIAGLHADMREQLQRFYEDTWQRYRAEAQRSQEALSTLQLSDQQVEDIASSRLLPLIGQQQRDDEERLAGLDECRDSVDRHVLGVSRWVSEVMRAVALLWETHCRRVKRREEELEAQGQLVKQTQQLLVERMMGPVDAVLAALRQESRQEVLDLCLDQVLEQLKDIRDSCRPSLSQQCDLLDQLPAVLMEELYAYSNAVSSFFRLSHRHRPSLADLPNVSVSSIRTGLDQESSSHSEMFHPRSELISREAGYSFSTLRFLSEAASSLSQLYNSSTTNFTSSGGVVYTGPAFRCPAPDLPDFIQETHLSVFPVELLSHTLTRTRILVLDHIEQSFKDLLGSAVAMVTEKKEVVRLEHELSLTPEYVRTQIYEPRLVELQLHRQLVDTFSEDVSNILTSCRRELHDLQVSIHKKNLELFDLLTSHKTTLQELQTSIQRDHQIVLLLPFRKRLEVFGAALQEQLDRHAEDTLRCQTNFKRMIRGLLEEARKKAAELQKSFRTFKEGGDYAPQEVKVFQKKMKEEIKRLSSTEDSIFSDLEVFESKSLLQLRKVLAPLDDKFSSLQAEVLFTEEVQKIISRTQIQIKAEASPDQICWSFWSVKEEIKSRCSYLGYKKDSVLQDSFALSRTKVRGAGLRRCRSATELREETTVRFCFVQEQKSKTVEEQSSVVQQRSTNSTRKQSLRRSSRPNKSEAITDMRTKRKYQIFGTKPEPELSSQSFAMALNTILWWSNDTVLEAARVFYSTKRVSTFSLVPESADIWVEGIQKRLVGYQEQAKKFLISSKDEVVKQLSVFRELLDSLPEVLISHHVGQQGAWLTEEVGVFRKRLEEELAAGKDQKMSNLGRLRVSLKEDELQTLESREERRQQQLHDAILRSHLELQECVRERAEQFVTLLASLTEKLLHLLDEVLPVAETDPLKPPEAESPEAEDVQEPIKSWTWPGITHLFPMTSESAKSPVTMTTAPISTAKSSQKHEAVIERRDAALKGFEQLIHLEVSRSEADRRNQLSEQQNWTSYWAQQVFALRQTQMRQR